MKQLMVLLASLPIMLILIMQISQTQINLSNANAVKDYAHASEYQAEKEGYFSASNIENLKTKIASKMKIDPDDIEISATDSEHKKYRSNTYSQSNLIYYKITVPVKKIMVGNNFFGIKDEDNKGTIVIEKYMQSELLAP